MRIRFCGLILGFCAISLPVSSHRVGAADRPAKAKTAEIRDFDVRVDNTVRGTHRLTIRSDGEEERAEIETDVKVDVFVYVYSFKCRGTEVWRDGRLVTSDVRCDDNGKKRAFALKKENDIQLISFNEKASKLQIDCVMSNAYWRLPHADLRKKTVPVADTDTGKTYQANLIHAGSETVTANGRTIACRRFKIDGVTPAELWFDDLDRLVKQVSVEQGHSTELRLKKIRLANDEK